jgi:porin
MCIVVTVMVINWRPDLDKPSGAEEFMSEYPESGYLYFRATLFLALLLSALVAPLACGQEADESDLLTRSGLTGDWWGARSSLADHGVTFDLRYTSFYQGLESGTGDQGYEYGGKMDALIKLDSEKLGLWEGGEFRVHLDYSHGNAPPNLGGAIFAANTALYWPVDTPDELVATSLNFSQKLGERSSIALGKFNPVDVYALHPFYGGWGIDRFMNIVLVAPPSGLIPVVFMGAVATIETEPVTWSIIVADPNDRTNDYFPGDLFSDGVLMAANATRVTALAGRRTTYGITGLYSTAEGADYSSIGGAVGTSTKTGAWNVNIQFTHDFQASSQQSDAAWGFVLKAGIADGNPNYVQRSLIVGIGGKALLFGRPQDSFGVGAYFYDLSDTLQDELNPVLTDFRDESAIEAFYSWTATPWLQIGANIQYINPARGRHKNALVPSLRTQIRF